MLKNALVLLVSSGGGAVLSFVLTALIARTFRPEGLGAYSAVLAWVYPLTLVAEWGVGTWLLRALGSTPTQQDALVRGAVRVRLLLSGGACVLLVIFAPLLFDNALLVTGARLAAPLLLIQPLFSTYSAVFRAHEAFALVAWLNVGMLGAQVALTAGYLAWGGDLVGVFALNTLTSLGQLGVAWGVYRARYRPADVQKPVALRVILRESTPYAGASVLAAVQLRIGILCLGRFATLEIVGYYVASLRFLEVVRLVAMAGYDVLFARVVNMDDPAARARLFRLGVWVCVAGGGAATLGMAGLAPVLLGVVYGAGYAGAVGVLVLMAVGVVPSLLRGLLNVFAYAGGRAWRANVAFGVWLLVFAISVGVIASVTPLTGEVIALASLVADVCAVAVLSRGDPLGRPSAES